MILATHLMILSFQTTHVYHVSFPPAYVENGHARIFLVNFTLFHLIFDLPFLFAGTRTQTTTAMITINSKYGNKLWNHTNCDSLIL